MLPCGSRRTSEFFRVYRGGCVAAAVVRGGGATSANEIVASDTRKATSVCPFLSVMSIKKFRIQC